jgi:3-deoxy-D-manno-octulosonic-acid transferase
VSAALFFYRLGTRLAAPFAGLAFRARVKEGKEDPARLSERDGRPGHPRPDGPLIWLHGASVGESLMLLGVFNALRESRPDLSGLITSQTLTSADLIARRAPKGLIHQMAPLDTPGRTARFIAHWQPDLAVFAESEIWPNLIEASRRAGVPCALVNARMTRTSLTGWARARGAIGHLLGEFGYIGAADGATAKGLSDLIGRPVPAVGNLKLSQPAPDVDRKQYREWKQRIGKRPVILAASTHAGEEAMVLSAYSALRQDARPLLIIAPRHPARGPEIAALVSASGFALRTRSQGEPPDEDAEIFLADTLGEMGLWYRLAAAVYLGGGHAPGVGGHNALEPVKLGKATLSGPLCFNFEEVNAVLVKAGALTYVPDAEALAAHFAACLGGVGPTPDWIGLAEGLDAPMTATLAGLMPLLPTRTSASDTEGEPDA